jgi:hypothetical protein
MKFSDLKCDRCPALSLRNKNSQRSWIEECETFKSKAIEEISVIKLYILCESFPANRYFYNPESIYKTKGLRFEIKKELAIDTDDEFFKYFKENGIVLTDCALCPLHDDQLTNTERRHAASICLQNNTLSILEINPNTPIITIFPSHRGYLKRRFPKLELRKKAKFNFEHLFGLKLEIEKYTK